MDLQENTYTFPVFDDGEYPAEPVPAAATEPEEPVAATIPTESEATPFPFCPEDPVIITEKPPKKKKWWILKLLALLLLVAVVCGATAYTVSYLWQDRYDRMERAMTEKINALKQLYSEQKPQQNNTQLPENGPLTPSQVYDKNVHAVVAIHAMKDQTGQYGESAGSGFLISADGYVATNYHVVEGAAYMEVVTHAGETLPATLVGKDATNDVALLKVEKENLPFAVLGSSDALTVGEMVVAIGNPLGELNSTLTVGYISGKDRIVSTDGTMINMLQTDAAINSGNSGGPLFNLKGEVVGITTAKYSGNSNSGATIEGLGFAIPMDDISRILTDLKDYGYVTGAYLGVTVRDVDASGQSYGLPAGAYVESVVKGNAAAKAGIRAGDIIVNLGGYDVDSLSALTRVLRRFEAGQTVSVTVYRAGKQEYLTITFDEKPVEKVENNSGSTQTPNNQKPSNGSGNWPGGFYPYG